MNILLASANRVVLKRWEGLISEKCNFSTAATIEELKQQCAAVRFDLVLLHRQLINDKSFQELRNLASPNRFFLLSDQPGEEEGLVYLKLGIVGYGNTFISSSRLEEAMRIIALGGVWLGQNIIQHLIRETHQHSVSKAGEDFGNQLGRLTKGERKIAELVARGQSNLEIAANLHITERTVKAHLTSVYEKTKTGSRLNLALLINRS